MKNKIYEILSGEFLAGQFLRVGENKNLGLYVGKDQDGMFAFDFRGKYKPTRITSSEVISVTQMQNDDFYYLRFSLQNTSLLEYFCTFCEDLLASTFVISNDETAYQTLRSRYYSWKQLFKPNHGQLSEFEIMGLIGELLFLKDYLFTHKGIDNALDSWTGPEKTHKDFSFDDVWFEIKTLTFGKETVHISSMEQLDSVDKGYLSVYLLEKMSPSYNGLRLNTLVNEIMVLLQNTNQKDIFMAKLDLYGFDFSHEYDNYVYSIKGNNVYSVEEGFPRITKGSLPASITKVQYEIIMSDIEQYKLESL